MTAGAAPAFQPSARSSSYFSSHELADIAGCLEALVRQYRRDGTFPAHWYGSQGYAPVCLAMVEAMSELGLLFGENSPTPKEVARQIAHKIEYAWHQSSDAASVMLHIDAVVDGSSVTISGPMKFLARAKQKLAAFAAA